ncbi:MAG TPA: MBL fold metallo-hydrolase [Verrucomicrobiae bacterium]|nr:MBL fold metallo-hydrolase [Verrucomicrobiae bacterium]
MTGIGLASGVAAVETSGTPAMRFVSQRMADLAKSAMPARHKPTPADWDSNTITAAWLGHATVLMNFEGVNVITDPVLFSRIGAYCGVGTIGPLRRQACALRPRELPKIDLVLLSHAHLDHFDIPSLNAIGRPQVVTAKNTSDLLNDTPLRSYSELSWGESAQIKTTAGEIEIEAFQVQHWGARWRHDTQRGYNGYILKRNGKQVIFGGDTALSSGFRGIRSKGPFEFACMPIGAYNPFIYSHCNPEQALQMANEAGAKYILPMHHYTFRFGREDSAEPLERLEAAMSAEPERLGWKEAGETFAFKA